MAPPFSDIKNQIKLGSTGSSLNLAKDLRG